MSLDVQSNKRIAKNAIMLYIRMFLVMGVSLYTSRLVLQALGVEDFGIYNIIGGVIVLFSFINNAMVASTQRFLNFELGKQNYDEARKVFSASLSIYFIISIVVFILSETIGLWFFSTYIQIPSNKIVEANYVYQFTILTFIINILKAPYNSAIIAHEKMNFYAGISVLEVFLKLLIVYILFYSSNRLVIYSILTMIVALIISSVYVFYCKKHFIICKYRFEFNKERFIALTSFSGWSLLGSVANIGSQHGINILLNMFFGVALNAAMGIANQVSNAIYQFVSNFQIAFNPQITKLYASGKNEQFLTLISNASRYSFYLLFVFALPITIYCNEILDLWLVTVPEYAVIFCKLLIFSAFFDTLSGPLWASVYASGILKKYQINISLLLLSILLVAYIVAKMDAPVEYVLFVKVIFNLIIYLYRLFYCCKNLNLNFILYFKDVLCRCFLVLALAVGVLIVLNHYVELDNLNVLIRIFIVLLIAVLCVLCVGLSCDEKNKLFNLLKEKYAKSF